MSILQKLAYKDFLVIIRDRGGLAMLFIMPMALVLIMTSLQNNTFKAINESGINLILLNNDPDSLGTAIEKEIIKSEFFTIHRQIKGKKPSDAKSRKLLPLGNSRLAL